jgi:hypothetical protein
MKPNKRLIRVGKIKRQKKRDNIPTPVAEPKVCEVVINTCYGGFGLSHIATMEYYKRKGITVYPFVDAKDNMKRFDFKHFEPYTGQENTFLIHYSSQPLRKDGTYVEESYLAVGRGIQRDDPDLVAVVKQMGKEASGPLSSLAIVEIPAEVEWSIEEYDGTEWISEAHRTWR